MTKPILTLTLSPSIDLSCEAHGVTTGHKTRTSANRFDPGGGGLNVAKVIHALGGDVRALLLLGGVTGRLITELLEQGGIDFEALNVAAPTRLSMTVHDRNDGSEYRFVPVSEKLSEAECQAALAALARSDAAWIMASGSMPPGAPVDFYGSAAEQAKARGQKFTVDTSGPALAAAMGRGVAVIKPSLREFEELVGRKLETAAEQDAAALDLVRTGAVEMVAMTAGEAGALLATRDGVIRRPAVAVEVRSTVGAGDSFLAALVLALSRGAGPDEALAWGMAAGASAVSHEGTAQIDRAEVEALAGVEHTA